jgi:ribonuclease VapC
LILDTSAVVAVVVQEPGYDGLIGKLASARSVGIGTPTLAETGIVLTARLGRDPRGLLARLLQELEVTPIPFGDPHWRAAVEAYRRFGKGRHAAALNFGDCMSYATARLSGLPLLCTGRDFAKTDLLLA